jgi:hypothetical protein
MSLSIEQLLIPRYLVIADMPFKPANWMYNVNDIITDDGKTTLLDHNGNTIFPLDWDNFTHIFKKLMWWEERKPSEMPHYVKTIPLFDSPIRFYEVKEWVFYIQRYGNGEQMIGFINPDDNEYHIGAFAVAPITKEEYETNKK